MFVGKTTLLVHHQHCTAPGAQVLQFRMVPFKLGSDRLSDVHFHKVSLGEQSSKFLTKYFKVSKNIPKSLSEPSLPI